jgi:hypothetical protein
LHEAVAALDLDRCPQDVPGHREPIVLYSHKFCTASFARENKSMGLALESDILTERADISVNALEPEIRSGIDLKFWGESSAMRK